MTTAPIRIHGYTHLKNGQDPVPLGETNDWMITSAGLMVPNSMATNIPYTSITYQTDDGSVYAPLSGAIDSIEIKQVGSYLVRSMFQLPAVAGTASVNANIAGDCTTYTYNDYSGPRPLQFYNGVGNPYLVWEQLVTVNDVTAPTSVYNVITQTTGATRSVVAYLEIFRLT